MNLLVVVKRNCGQKGGDAGGVAVGGVKDDCCEDGDGNGVDGCCPSSQPRSVRQGRLW